MVRSDSPYIVDIYLVSIRWILFFSAVIGFLAVGGGWQLGDITLVAYAAWNTLFLWMAGRSQRFTSHRETTLLVDLILSLGIILLGHSTLLTQFLILLIPISTASMYFNLRGGAAAGLISALVHVFLIRNTTAALPVLFSLAYGLTFGYLSQLNYDSIQKNRKWQIEQRERQHKAETGRIRAIYNLSATITSILSYNRVLEATLDLSTDALSMNGSIDTHQDTPGPTVSAMFLENDGAFHLVTSRNLQSTSAELILQGSKGYLAKLKDDPKPLIIHDLENDPELATIGELANCKAVYLLPMVTGYEMYGVMLFGHPSTDYFTQERCDILGIVSKQAVVAIQNARLYQEISDEKEKIAEVEEETRKKIARDLHDGPTQSVTAIAMRVNLARRMLNRDPLLTSEELIKIEELARQTTREIRHMLFSLRPVILETEGLTAAIKAIAEKMKEIYGKSIHLEINERMAAKVDLNKASVLFYIIDEAVTNAQKHANAEHISVILGGVKSHPDILSVQIIDDGIGFDLDEVNRSYDKSGSLGLINLRERTEILNGLLNIHSQPENGTRIHLFVPLSEEAMASLREMKPSSDLAI